MSAAGRPAMPAPARPSLLFLSPLYPVPVRSGTQFRVMSLLDRLSRRFDITFLSLVPAPISEADLDSVRPYCHRIVTVVPDNKRDLLRRIAFKLWFWVRRVTSGECDDRFYTMMPSVARAIRNELAATPFDVLFLSYWFWSPWPYCAPGLKVIDANDVQSERVAQDLKRSRNPVERLLQHRLLARYQAWEADAVRAADVVVATTRRDSEVFSGWIGGRGTIVVAPTGIDTDHFAPQPVAPEPRHVVFYGALRNPLNIDAVQHLVADVLPLIRVRVPNVRLTIVGAAPGREIQALPSLHPDITVTGTVEDVRAPLARAAVVVLPLRMGHGIRGRVFELMGMGIPVVATSVAVAGMDLKTGDGLLIADTPDGFAAAVAHILEDDTFRAALGRRGREIAVERLSLEATYDPLVRLLEERASCGPDSAHPSLP